MSQKTDLNVSPYYDDFDATDNFNRVLFRPGYAVQARELTTLQSILQNQIERHGNHMFKEGAMVIPGQISFSDNYYSIQLVSTFGGEDVAPAQYYNATTPVIITGATSGVQAKVIGFKAATSTTQPLLYVQYIKTGSDYKTEIFSDSENISADASITHTTTYSSNSASATTHSSSAAPKREQRYTVTPDPVSSGMDDDFGFNETSSFFTDAKTYNPSTGQDE